MEIADSECKHPGPVKGATACDSRRRISRSRLQMFYLEMPVVERCRRIKGDRHFQFRREEHGISRFKSSVDSRLFDRSVHNGIHGSDAAKSKLGQSEVGEVRGPADLHSARQRA